MADPDIPARPAPYTGGVNKTYPGSQQPTSSTDLPYIESGTQGKGFARGWFRPLLNILTGRTAVENGAVRATKPDGAREILSATDRDLQSGPSPVGITRIHTQKIGGSGFAEGQIGLPLTGSLYIPHQNIDRRDGGKISRGPALTGGMADDMHIPAIYAGNQNNG